MASFAPIKVCNISSISQVTTHCSSLLGKIFERLNWMKSSM